MGNFQVVPLMESYRIPCTCTGRIVSKLNQSGMGWVKIIENSGAQKWDGRDMLGFFNQSSNLTYFPSKLEKKTQVCLKKMVPHSTSWSKVNIIILHIIQWPFNEIHDLLLRTIAKALNVQKKGLGEMMYV